MFGRSLSGNGPRAVGDGGTPVHGRGYKRRDVLCMDTEWPCFAREMAWQMPLRMGSLWGLREERPGGNPKHACGGFTAVGPEVERTERDTTGCKPPPLLKGRV